MLLIFLLLIFFQIQIDFQKHFNSPTTCFAEKWPDSYTDILTLVKKKKYSDEDVKKILLENSPFENDGTMDKPLIYLNLLNLIPPHNLILDNSTWTTQLAENSTWEVNSG